METELLDRSVYFRHPQIINNDTNRNTNKLCKTFLTSTKLTENKPAL